MVKILHIWDQSGVGSTLGCYMDNHYGTETKIITRSEFDPYHQTTYGERLNCGATRFVLTALWKAWNYDIMHVDSLDKILWPMHILCHQPLIMHYHGTELRTNKRKRWKNADKILYSTPDLKPYLPETATYLPTPIDTETFTDLRQPRKEAVYFPHWYEPENLAWKVAENYGLSLHVQSDFVPYAEMPKFLNQYEYVIDRFQIHSLSRLALEALASGCKVICWDGQILDRFPSEHRVENVAKQLHQIYMSVLA